MSWQDVGPRAQDRPRMGDIEHHHPGKHSHIYLLVPWASLRLHVFVPILCLRGSSRHTLSTRGRVFSARDLQSRLSTYDLPSTTSTLPCQLSPLVHSSPALRMRVLLQSTPDNFYFNNVEDTRQQGRYTRLRSSSQLLPCIRRRRQVYQALGGVNSVPPCDQGQYGYLRIALRDHRAVAPNAASQG